MALGDGLRAPHTHSGCEYTCFGVFGHVFPCNLLVATNVVTDHKSISANTSVNLYKQISECGYAEATTALYMQYFTFMPQIVQITKK